MKKLALVITFLTVGTMALAQWGNEEMAEKPSVRDRIFVGGGLGGISFSSYYDFVAVNGLVGYKITPKLAGGVQLQYKFTKYKQTTPEFNAHDYGISPFLRFNFYGPLFLHVEYEYLSYEYPSYPTYEKTRDGYSSFMGGGGFFQPIGRNAGFYFAALYNFTYRDPQSPYDFYPYNSPLVIRAGVTAGF